VSGHVVRAVEANPSVYAIQAPPVGSPRYTTLFAVARLMTCSFTVKPMLRSWAVT